MIFFAITPLLIGCFGNFCIPLLIGARDMAFPRLNMLSFWVFAAAQAVALCSLVLPPAAPAAGWTLYPPLSTGLSTPGPGMTAMVAALLLAGIATVLGAINYVTTVISHRAPGMTWMRLPLTVWGLWLTAILNALFVPALTAATILLLCDRLAGTQFFAAATGDPLLYQHLFWIFGHPEVYILILPVWGVIGDLVSFFARRPAHWYRGSVGAMVLVTILSGIVYGHHLFVAGLSPLAGVAFELFTLAISAPAIVLAVNWLMTLWGGRLRLTTPMLFSLGTILVFGLGGLTALPLAAVTADIYLHDTLYVVGHFHLIMAAATLMGSFAAVYFWFPKMFGRQMHRGLGIAHFAGTLLFSLFTFGGQIAAGYAGQLRRLADPTAFDFLSQLGGLHRHTSYAAFALGAFQLLFAINFFHSLWRGKPVGENPWQVGTLEWTVSSPPPRENFAVPPQVVRGPHEFAGDEGQVLPQAERAREPSDA
jgi:cytochrome c oxidase subunit 1